MTLETGRCGGASYAVATPDKAKLRKKKKMARLLLKSEKARVPFGW